MSKILIKKKFSEIQHIYDSFFLDLYGVTHNGLKLFPGILNVLKKLKQLNKTVIFISNAPRRSSSIKKVLSNFGLKSFLYKDVISSGDITYEYFLKKMNNLKCYHIGTEKDKNMFKGLNNAIVEEKNLGKSDFILNTGVYENAKVEDYENVLKKAQSISLKMVCSNPDLEIIRGKKKEICAGSIAMRYEQLGGEVKYYGKPYSEIYQKSYEAIKIKNKKKILAIGDSLRTDINGANKFGLDSALVLTGILKNIKEIENFCRNANIYPKFLLNRLEW